MDPLTVGSATGPVSESALAAPSSSPELRRVLASIRILVAVVAATEAVSLTAANREALLLVVLGYAAYAGWLCWVELNGHAPLLPRLTSWIDAVWILFFTWLAGTQTSVFILLLLFPILFASLSFGFASGLLVSLFAALVAATELMLLGQQGGRLAPDAMLQPLSLLVLGPLTAGLARAGVQMNDQRTLTDHLLAHTDPRLGVRRVAETLLRALTPRFDADVGLLLAWLPDSEPRLFRCDRAGNFIELSGALRATLLAALDALPRDIAGAYRLSQLFGRYALHHYAGFDVDRRASTNAGRAAAEQLADLIDARSLVAVPTCRRAPHASWLVLESGRQRYRSRDAELLAGVMEQLAPVIENAGLLERLADEAIATERARIGRDLHDSAIQPYLGLKYGIEALARKAGPDNPLHDDIRALRDRAISELHQLRELVTGMRSGASGADDALAPALQRQAKRFSELFGIDVAVRCDGGLDVGRKVAAAIFPMVDEALTNIRRHTDAHRADVVVGAHDDAYVLQISNEHDRQKPPPPFVPRSIVERAESLDGHATVERSRPGFTDLIISIPRTTGVRT